MNVTEAEMSAMIDKIESLGAELRESRRESQARIDDLICQLRLAHGMIRRWRDRHGSVCAALILTALANVGLIALAVLR